MPYTDAQGRPELLMHPDIGRDTARYRRAHQRPGDARGERAALVAAVHAARVAGSPGRSAAVDALEAFDRADRDSTDEAPADHRPM